MHGGQQRLLIIWARWRQLSGVDLLNYFPCHAALLDNIVNVEYYSAVELLQREEGAEDDLRGRLTIVIIMTKSIIKRPSLSMERADRTNKALAGLAEERLLDEGVRLPIPVLPVILVEFVRVKMDRALEEGLDFSQVHL